MVKVEIIGQKYFCYQGTNWTTSKGVFRNLSKGGGVKFVFCPGGTQNSLWPKNPGNHRFHWSLIQRGLSPIALLNTQLTTSLDTKIATFDKKITFYKFKNIQSLKYYLHFFYKRLVFSKKFIFKCDPWNMNILLLL